MVTRLQIKTVVKMHLVKFLMAEFLLAVHVTMVF